MVIGSGLALTVFSKVFILGLPEAGEWLGAHFGHEWPTPANLMLLLVGFALLADHFEQPS